MNENNIEQILKQAIIMEQQGRIFYENITVNTESTGLQKIFRTMAAEELIHEKTLRNRLKNRTDKIAAKSAVLPVAPSEFADTILTDEIMSEISGASYEAAAISAAMGLEVRTLEFYKASAESADSEEEKELFNELSKWESTHLKILSKLNRDILQRAAQNEVY